MEPPDQKTELYSLLVHPGLRPAYEEYKERGKVVVVIYTRRPQLLQYRSCVTGKVLPLRYEAGWHYGGQVHIPSSMREAKSVQERYSGPSLDEDEEHDVLKGLERLLAARDAVAQALGLSSPMLQTSCGPQVQGLAAVSGVIPGCLQPPPRCRSSLGRQPDCSSPHQRWRDVEVVRVGDVLRGVSARACVWGDVDPHGRCLGTR